MSDNDNADQQANGGAAYVANTNFKVLIPSFDPAKADESGWVNAQAWVRSIDRAIRAAGKNAEGEDKLEDSMVSAIAISHLKGAAQSWIEKLEKKEEGGTEVTALHSWKELKTAFSKRYFKMLTLSEQVSKLRGLNQMAKESVMDFQDRVENQTFDLFESAWQKADPYNAVDKKAKEKGRATISGLLFAAGLHDTIREKACISAPAGTSNEEFLEIARRIEQAERDKKQRHKRTTEVNVVSETSESSDAEVDEVEKRKKKKKAQWKGKQQDKPKKPDHSNYECFYCHKIGHIAENCFKKQKMLAGQKQKQRRDKEVSETTGEPQCDSVDLIDFLQSMGN